MSVLKLELKKEHVELLKHLRWSLKDNVVSGISNDGEEFAPPFGEDSIYEAIDLIFECLKKSKTSVPYVSKMKSMKINDLLEAMIIKYSPNKKPKIRIIGLQKGENLHELISEDMPDSFHSERFTIKEILKRI